MKRSVFCAAVLLLMAVGTLAQRQSRPLMAAEKNDACQIFVYSPDDKAGLHVAFLNGKNHWEHIGQLCSSDYSRWGSEKRMYNPFVLRATDGTWRAVWAVNDYAPCFAAAYSDDLMTWRPQDYPKISIQGVAKPVIKQKADGSFDLYMKSKQGMLHVEASADFRQFKEVATGNAMEEWTPDTATIDGTLVDGNLFEVSKDYLNQIRAYFKTLADEAKKNQETMRDDAERFKNLPQVVKASLRVSPSKSKAISDKLVGIFFEDISYAADGGLYAELVQNRDFEYTAADHKGWHATTAWKCSAPLTIATGQPLSANNPHYVVIAADTLYNEGWDGICDRGAQYDFSLYARLTEGGSQSLSVALVSEDGFVMAEGKLKVADNQWQRYTLSLNTANKKRVKQYGDSIVKCQLMLVGKKNTKVALDMISLFPHDTFKGHGLRKDLAQVIADLQPKFVRFPGGCMSHGDGIENIYHWNHTIGSWQDRVPDKNIWNYHQTRGLGFYEYFQFCEDIGAEPLPVLAAGVPCQNSGVNAEGYGGQQGGIPMEQMPAYCQEILDMIEWANGDPATSQWAKMRAEAGHPAPFNLKYVGIGNEDIISTTFEERYLMICQAIKKKYPEIIVCGTVGPFHAPSADYIEGWKFAKSHADVIDMVDEHYYESTGWFMNHQDYYDNYDRKAPKVYLGEWASRTRTMESALVEAMHLCHIERNADVVAMTSYAPLLCKEGHHNWNPDLIYFSNTDIMLTPSYYTQQLFSVNDGVSFIESQLLVGKAPQNRVAVSVVKTASNETVLKLVNALPSSVSLDVSGLTLNVSEVQGFYGQPTDQKVKLFGSTAAMKVNGDNMIGTKVNGNTITLPPYSVSAIRVK